MVVLALGLWCGRVGSMVPGLKGSAKEGEARAEDLRATDCPLPFGRGARQQSQLSRTLTQLLAIVTERSRRAGSPLTTAGLLCGGVGRQAGLGRAVKGSPRHRPDAVGTAQARAPSSGARPRGCAALYLP